VCPVITASVLPTNNYLNSKIGCCLIPLKPCKEFEYDKDLEDIENFTC
jgi:hypothetical protein